MAVVTVWLLVSISWTLFFAFWRYFLNIFCCLTFWRYWDYKADLVLKILSGSWLNLVRSSKSGPVLDFHDLSGPVLARPCIWHGPLCMNKKPSMHNGMYHLWQCKKHGTRLCDLLIWCNHRSAVIHSPLSRNSPAMVNVPSEKVSLHHTSDRPASGRNGPDTVLAHVKKTNQ